MKIVLFQGGAAGVEYRLPEDEPAVPALMDLLEGEVESRPLCGRLWLVCRVEAAGLPTRYVLHRLGRAVEPVRGDVAVVSMYPDRRLGDIRDGDVAAANTYIKAVGGNEA